MKNAIVMLYILLLVFAAGCSVKKPIGGEKDGHGCLIAAGYAYDENIRACTRNWELDESQARAAKIAIGYLDPLKGATIDNVAVARCPGCFVVDVKLHLNSGDKNVLVNIENWEVIEKKPEEGQGLSPEGCEEKGGRAVNIVGGDSCDENEVNIGPVIGFISPNICCVPGERLTEEEALEIAEKSGCISEGMLTEDISYNPSTNTYWIGLVLKEEKPGCNPACVVYEAYKKAEVNYRCTGMLPPG